MQTYESSTATLRAILAHPLLQRDKVDETMEAMASANAEARDLDDAIRIGIDVAQADTGIDDAELEDELNNLIKEAEAVKSQQTEQEVTEEVRAKLAAVELSVPSDVPVRTPSMPQDSANKVQETA